MQISAPCELSPECHMQSRLSVGFDIVLLSTTLVLTLALWSALAKNVFSVRTAFWKKRDNCCDLGDIFSFLRSQERRVEEERLN